MLLVGTPNAINATLYENLDFNFMRDIAPVASLIRGALVMVVHPSVPANTLSHDLLGSTGKTTLDCRVTTQIDTPNEVFDTYGRLVGDIEVTVNGKLLNLNHWLVEQGWAYPTFYSSMTNDEINALLALAKTTRSNKTLVWKFLSKTAGPFDFNLREPPVGNTSVLATDKGPAIFPKLFRRYTNFSP